MLCKSPLRFTSIARSPALQVGVALGLILSACGSDSKGADAIRDAAAEDGSSAHDAGEEASCDPSCAPNEQCDDGTCVAVETATSITQYGVTWTFSEARPIGQFITGDWWVVGPVTISSVSPNPTDSRNGSMLNPVGAQAYDSRGGTYDGEKAVAFPLELAANNSLVSSISHGASECMQGSADGYLTYNGDCQRGPIHTQAVLTVVSAAPEPDAFRPAYSDVTKTIHRASAIDWSALPLFAPIASLPDGESMLRHIERPWIDHLGSWTMQHGCATHNMFCYGRELGEIVSNVSVYALFDTPQREAIALHLIQLGIDNFGVVAAGGGWGGDGGHFNGRKWPIVFAGAMLGVAEMTSPGLTIGNEDRMTYSAGGQAFWGRDCTSPYFENGCSGSGSKDCRPPSGTGNGCSDYRVCCTSHTWVGEALVARLMQVDDAWGHQPFFDYVDQWIQDGGATSAAFVTEAWELYR